MNSKIEEGVSLPLQPKETFGDRVKVLLERVGHHSVRSAAIAWGLPYATLNNYVKKGTEPGISAVQTISQKTGANLEWLVTGEGSAFAEKTISDLANKQYAEPINKVSADIANQETSKLANSWMDIFQSLSTDEAQRLIRLFHRKGIENAIQLLLASTPATAEQDDVDAALEAIEKLQTRNTLKGTLRSVLLMGLESGNAEIDREILDGIESIKRAQAPGGKEENLSPVSNEQKKTG